jgi:hypothetical protein
LVSMRVRMPSMGRPAHGIGLQTVLNGIPPGGLPWLMLSLRNRSHRFKKRMLTPAAGLELFDRKIPLLMQVYVFADLAGGRRPSCGYLRAF